MRRRVIATLLRDWVDPAVAFLALTDGNDAAFWLDSGVDATRGFSYLGTTTRVVTSSISRNVVTESPSGISHPPSILDYVKRDLLEPIDLQGSPVGTAQAGPFTLGWVGWLGYEEHAQTMGIAPTRHSRYPDSAFLFVDRVVAFDHETRTVTLLALGDEWVGDLAQWRDTVEALLAAATESVFARSVTNADSIPPRVEWAYPDATYLNMVESCKRSIAAGDAFQLCLTSEARVAVTPDPRETYLALRELSPAHHGGFLRVGEVCLLSSSPEQFLSVTPEGIVESRPIKGTRKRGSSTNEDEKLRAELLASEKERAENLMIVDLVRNDIARVCELGSVSVPKLWEVESYPQVHQLVSTVRGRLRAGLSGVDAVVACFPAGSMTGAPKHSAVQLLDALEQRPRGIYSGVFGYFGFDGRVDLAMVIRSIVLDPRGATIGAGGGITALSVPTEELEEVRLKAAALVRVLGAVDESR